MGVIVLISKQDPDGRYVIKTYFYEFPLWRYGIIATILSPQRIMLYCYDGIYILNRFSGN